MNNGAHSYGSTDATATAPQNVGAYTLGTATSGTAPAKNANALVYIPTENEWYKAAYYRGGGTNGGYWDFATGSDIAPTPVTASATGVGSAGSTGNYANYNHIAVWNGHAGNLTTVGTNGGSSEYGTFDQGGNVWEWNDLAGLAGTTKGRRGGNMDNTATYLQSSFRVAFAPDSEGETDGFRLASTLAATVPEVDPAGMGSVLALVIGALGLLERRRLKAKLA